MGIPQVPEQGGDIVQTQFDPKPLQSEKIGQSLRVICFACTFIFQVLFFILPFPAAGMAMDMDLRTEDFTVGGAAKSGRRASSKR